MRARVGGILLVMAEIACTRSVQDVRVSVDAAVQSAADAGAADAAVVVAAPPDSDTGINDAGMTSRDAGAVLDAGVASDDGGINGGVRLNCTPSGELVPAWSLVAPFDRFRPNDTYQWYRDARSDSAGGVLVDVDGSAGWATYTGFFTTDRDGRIRIPFQSVSSCHAAQPLCLWESPPIAADRYLFRSGGGIQSALDGGLVAGWDGNAPLTPDGGTFRYDNVLAADGHRAVFAKTDLWAGSPVQTLLTEIGLDGGTIWQRIVSDGFPRGIALDESGTAHLLFDDMQMAFDADGRTLFTMALTQPASTPPFVFLNAGGGRVYWSDRTLLDARDGGVSARLPFQPIGSALLTPSRIIVQERVGDAYGPLHAVDLATGAIVWTRDVIFWWPSFRIAGRFVLVLDPDRTIHLVDADGRDALACQLPTDALGVGVLLTGGRLVVPRGASVDAYDLPFPLDGN